MNKVIGKLVIVWFCIAGVVANPVYCQEQITANFKFSDPGKQYDRVFIPGSFNDWGPNTDGRIAVDAPSLMTYNETEGIWEKELELTIGESFQYKFHVHKNADGSENEWFTDPLNSLNNGSPDFNSIVNTSDPMFFQTRKGVNDENKVFFNTSVFSTVDITEVSIVISGEEIGINSNFDESNQIIEFQSDIICDANAIYKLQAKNMNGDFATELLTCGEGSFTPDWAKDAVWYQIFPERFRNGDPSNDPVRGSLEAPQFNNAPSDWATTPWESDWYDRANWEKGVGGNFYNDGVFLRRYGGDIQGVIDQLDYLEELGINAIYFNPVFWGPSLHKFDVASYHHIDPHFGPDPEGDKSIIASETENPETWDWTTADLLFLDLLQEAKSRKIRVIIDGVFNHSGRGFFAFQDLLENQSSSPYAEWYDVITFDNPNTSANEFAYNSFFGFESLPEFANDASGSTLVAPVKEYFFNITKRWMDPNGDGDPSDGIDGWRLDASALVPNGYWAEWNTHVRSINSDAYTTLEEFGPAADLVEEGRFSAAMNYQAFTFPIQGYFIIQEQSSLDFWQRITNQFDGFEKETRLVMQNLTNSHDTERVGSMMVNNSTNGITANPLSKSNYLVRKPNEEERYRQKLTVLFQIGYQGAPMFYYGTESGMWGATDPDDRMPMNWPDVDFDKQASHPFGLDRPEDDINFDQNLFNYYKNVIRLRHQYEATRRGEVVLVNAGDPLIFKRTIGTDEVYFAINNKNNVNNAEINDPSDLLEAVFYTHDIPSDLNTSFSGGKHVFQLPAYGGAVFAAKGTFAVNEVPKINGASTELSTDEDTPLILEKSMFDITDGDDVESQLTLTIIAGNDYEVSGSQVTPLENFNGDLIVKVQAFDGKDKSAILRTIVTVSPVNDAPVLEGVKSELMVTEGETITILAEQLNFTDPDNQSIFDFSVLVATGDNYTLNGASITPDPGFTGTLNVPVKVFDGVTSSNEVVVQVKVNIITDIINLQNGEWIKLFPIPALDELNMSVNNDYSGDIDVNIIDQTGRILYQHRFRKNTRELKETLAIQTLTCGIYFIEIVQGTFVSRMRFIK